MICMIGETKRLDYDFGNQARARGLLGGMSSRTDTKMRARIKDEFTRLKISRQRKYQLRMKRDKRCTECGQPAAEGSRCLEHLVMARERQRKKRRLKRRYHNTLSYRLEALPEATGRQRAPAVARVPRAAGHGAHARGPALLTPGH